MKRLLTGLCVTAALLSAGCASDSPTARDSVAAAATQNRDKASAAPRASGGGVSAETQFMTSAVPDPVAARIGDRTITTSQVMAPLLADQGLNVLLHLVQLELAKINAEDQRVTVSPGDVADERERTVARMLEAQEKPTLEQIEALRNAAKNAEADKIEAAMRGRRPALLAQVLVQQYTQTGQYVSAQQLDLAIETNTYLRKIAEPMLDSKITEDMLEKRYAVQFGEKAVIRHIQGANAREIAAALRRFREAERIIDAQSDASEKERRLKKVAVFADLAKQVSRNPETARVGGQLPPFTVHERNLPQSFKDVAFALKPGEVSDALHAPPNFHVILLEDKLRQPLAPYDQVRESLRAEVKELLVQAQVKKWREEFAGHIVANLKVEQPVLKERFAEFAAKLRESQAKLREQQKIEDAMEAEREMSREAGAGSTESETAAEAGLAGPTDPGPATKPATKPAPAPRKAVPKKAGPSSKPAKGP